MKGDVLLQYDDVGEVDGVGLPGNMLVPCPEYVLPCCY